MLLFLSLQLALAGASVPPPCPTEGRALLLQEDAGQLLGCAASPVWSDAVWGAHALEVAGRFTEAARLYRRLGDDPTLAPLSTTFRLHEARALLAARRPAQGVERLKGLAPTRRWETAELAAARADLFLAAGRFDDAIKAAREAIKLRHVAPDAAWLTLARASLALGQVGAYREAIRRLQIDHPDSPATAVGEKLAPSPAALPALSAAEWASRWAHWTAHGGASAVAAECPVRAKALQGSREKLAGARLQCGRAMATAHLGTSVEMLRSAAVGQSKPTALLVLAQIAARKKDPAPVAKLCVEMAPTKAKNELAECQFLAAFVTLQSGDHPAAQAAMQKVMEAFPAHARAADAAWFVAFDSLHTAQAPAQFDRLVAAAKDSGERARALYWRGRVREEAHLPGATEDWKQALTADPLGYYGWLAASRVSNPPAAEAKGCTTARRAGGVPPPEARAALMLLEGGFGREAAQELGEASAIRGEHAYAWADLLAGVDQWERVLDIGVANGSRARWPVADADQRGVEALYPRAFPQAVSRIAAETNPCLVLAVMRRESRFDPDATSPAEAVGLLQLLPKTAASLAKELSIEVPRAEHLHDPALNVKLGAHYIRRLQDRFGSPLLAAAAYNAGAHAVANWTKANANQQVDEWVERIPYRETRNYAKAVGGAYAAYSLIYGGSRPAIDWTPIVPAVEGIDY